MGYDTCASPWMPVRHTRDDAEGLKAPYFKQFLFMASSWTWCLKRLLSDYIDFNASHWMRASIAIFRTVSIYGELKLVTTSRCLKRRTCFRQDREYQLYGVTSMTVAGVDVQQLLAKQSNRIRHQLHINIADTKTYNTTEIYSVVSCNIKGTGH